MSQDKTKGLQEQIETQALSELSSALYCSNCGSSLDASTQEVPNQLVNGIEVRGRAYCKMCEKMGALKEGWMPQSGGRIARMFVVK